ncbi:MAG: M56 family metallopeptidase [Bacteroides sp.]|nr:M56 family metallopeptidase [Bacteroides sp.]
MAPEWIYLLKVNVGIALFYAFYKLFCCRDTFFQWRRVALLSFLAVSFLYPFLNIRHWVQEQPSMNELAEYYAALISLDEVTVAEAAPTRHTPDALTVFSYIYLTGIVILAVRFLIQLLSIFRLKVIGKPMVVDGVRIISLPEPANPFSFFQWIFAWMPQLEEEGRKEILTHELTHVRQRHSIDVILSELATIVCWMNPFVWLLKGEIRLNLEYLADNKVAQSVRSTKQYQYHLLGLANQNSQTGLYNHFNVSHLKNRIVMMNKKRTRTTGRIKYALFAPLAATLLLVSNIETVARTTVRIAKEVTQQATTDQDDPVFMVVEQMPEFPGGMAECMKWLQANIKYPAEAKEKGEHGRVIVQFIVERDGSVTNPTIKRGVSPSIDAEAIRVLNAMPKWKPGTQRGQAVRVKYTLPVKFSEKGEVEFKTSRPEPEADEKGIYRVADEMPEFPGGMGECMKWLGKTMRYPSVAHANGISGRVIMLILRYFHSNSLKINELDNII